MQKRLNIKAVTREKDAAGKFQTNLTPNATLEGKELIERWADFSRLNAAQAETTLVLLKGFILEELAKGNKLDFGLVSFYPRLSGALSSRDSSPEAEGLYVRGAVKARRPLMNGLKDKLEAVNGLTTVQAHIYNVFDKKAKRFDVLATGHVLSVAGYGRREGRRGRVAGTADAQGLRARGEGKGYRLRAGPHGSRLRRTDRARDVRAGVLHALRSWRRLPRCPREPQNPRDSTMKIWYTIA